jgi:glycerol kinase
MPELLLAIDIGTSSVSAAIFSLSGDLVSLSRAPVTSSAPRPGQVEQDAEAVWRAAKGAVDKALATAKRKPKDLAALGVTTQRASAVVWDKRNGKALAPMIVWSDLRGAARAAELQQAGYMVVPQMAAAKLEAAVASIPDGQQLMAQGRLAWGNIDAFLIFKLTGGAAHITDRSQAWPTGYLNLGTMGWNTGLIEHQGLKEAMFPTLVDTWGALGVTSAKVFGAAVPICADIADQQSALIAHGETAGDSKVSYGTSATLNLNTGGAFLYKSPTAPPFVLTSIGGETRFCLEGMVYSAGSAFDWLRNTCGLGDVARFEQLAASVPDAGGAFMLPALQGLGAPHGDFDKRGVIGGLSGSTTSAHLARAAMEGVAARVREVFDHLYAVTEIAPPAALRVDGGLTGNATFMQIQADLLGRPVMRHAAREATACGAAIGAGRGAGLLTDADVAAFTRYDRTFEPAVSADESEGRYRRWMAQAYG